MVQPTTARGTKLKLLLGDATVPPNYVQFCGLNARSITFQANTNEFFVGDCDNPDSPAWRELAKSGKFVSITGAGLLDTKGALSRMQAAWDDDDPVPMKVELNISAANGGGSWTGLFMVTTLAITGNDGELVQVTVTIESSSPVIWTPAT